MHNIENFVLLLDKVTKKNFSGNLYQYHHTYHIAMYVRFYAERIGHLGIM